MNWRKHLKPNQTPIDIAVVSSKYVQMEPQLLEALANHPACRKLYYIPNDAEGNWEQALAYNQAYWDLDEDMRKRVDVFGAEHAKLREPRYTAYDITALLKRKTLHPPFEEDAQAALNKAIREAPRVELAPKEIDCAVVRSHESLIGPSLSSFGTLMVDDPHAQQFVGNKLQLPEIAEITEKAYGHKICPPIAAVYSVEEAQAFMRKNSLDQIVLKTGDGIGGCEIFKLYREHPKGPLLAENINTDKHAGASDLGPKRFLAEHWNGFPSEGMLAMKWLQPERGDVRVICFYGRMFAALKRMPKEGSWLANVNQGAELHYFNIEDEFAQSDIEKLSALDDVLRDNGVNFYAVDLLEDENGERFVSEINTSICHDIRRVDHKNRVIDKRMHLCAADEMADIFFDEYWSYMHQRQDVEQSQMQAAVEHMQNGQQQEVAQCI